MPPGERAQLVEVPAGDRAADHVQQVGLDVVALPRGVQELGPQRGAVPADVVVQPDRQHELVGARGGEQPPVVALGLLQHPADQREQQVDLHADQQEVHVVAGAGDDSRSCMNASGNAPRVCPLAA